MWYDTTVGAHYSYGSPESTANAWEIYNYFRSLSPPWAVESIAALCGNFQLESVMNPCIPSIKIEIILLLILLKLQIPNFPRLLA